MTKREILLAICENPGWQPPQPIGQQTETLINQLFTEGWIAPRLDGWEATAEALDCYPRFGAQLDIADPEATMRGEAKAPVEPVTPSAERVVVAVATLDGTGYEVYQKASGQYGTDVIGVGSRRLELGHYASIRLLAELTRLLSEVLK